VECFALTRTIVRGLFVPEYHRQFQDVAATDSTFLFSLIEGALPFSFIFQASNRGKEFHTFRLYSRFSPPWRTQKSASASVYLEPSPADNWRRCRRRRTRTLPQPQHRRRGINILISALALSSWSLEIMKCVVKEKPSCWTCRDSIASYPKPLSDAYCWAGPMRLWLASIVFFIVAANDTRFHPSWSKRRSKIIFCILSA